MSLVLVVDDDAQSRLLLRHVLENAGHAVTEASNGKEAIRLANSNGIELVVLDILLPELSGWHVCRQMRSDLATRHIPIIMITGYANQSDEMRAWESGVAEYMTKPWAVEPFLAAVSRLVSHKKGALNV